MTDKEKIRAEVVGRIECYKGNYPKFHNRVSELENILAFIDSLQTQPEFKVGDTIRKKGDGLEAKVTSIDDSGFIYAACEDWEQIINPKEWELVEYPVEEDESLIPRMKHAIGLDNKEPKDGVYEAYRNYSVYDEPVDDWELLVKYGYAERSNIGGQVTYHLTDEGLLYVARKENILIKYTKEYQ